MDRRNWPLFATAVFAVTWIVHRALVQSITLDEADTFIHWVATDWAAHWEPHSNNHVLNSSLMRASIWLFGLSHFAARAPALLGGVLYISSAYRLCRLVSGGALLTWTSFVCLVYNPFIMDYLVAARGYGLALGFLSLAIYLFARMTVSQHETLKHAAYISACCGLSICANFSFAFASSALLLIAAALGALRTYREQNEWRTWAKLGLGCAVPGLMILLVLAGSALTDFPRDQLFWGTDSLRNMWTDIREASFLELNPYLVNPLLARWFHKFEHHALKGITIALSLYLLLLLGARRDAQARSRLLLAGGLATVFTLTVLAHWLQFKLLKIPLPLERTSIFFVPLLTACAGAILSVTGSNAIERAVRASGIALMMILGLYFAGELRDSYFREWRDNADVRAAFPVLLDLCRQMNVRQVPSDWNVRSALSFYRALNHVTDIDEFPHFDADKMPPAQRIYVLPESVYADFIHKQGLKPIWHGTVSDLVILVRPEAPGL